MDKLEVYTAFDQKLMGQLPFVDHEEAFATLGRLHSAHQDRKKWMSKFDRIQLLGKVAHLVESRRIELAHQAASEGGKPLTDSLVEIDRGIEGIKIAIKEISHIHGNEIPMGISPNSAGRMAYTKHFPRGVILAISAFNHPFNLIVHQVIPAIAAGCPVIVKPASTTPLSCKSLVEILYESGLNENYCQMVVCRNDVAEALAKDRRISFLSFIGSGRVGWHLRSILPPGATCALEHGGVAPAIVDKTADLEKAIPLLIKGGFYHAGQVCVSVQRIYIDNAIISDFISKFTIAAQKLKVGDPLKMETEVGPLISPKEVERIDTWVKKATEGGARLLAGGKKVMDTCYEPTILLDPPLESEVSTKEIFGPVVCLYGYDVIEEAFESANKLDFAFQASVFSHDLRVVTKAIDELDGLAIMINDHTAFRVDWMPFGGYKQSGLGVGGIPHSIKDMLIEKMFVINTLS